MLKNAEWKSFILHITKRRSIIRFAHNVIYPVLRRQCYTGSKSKSAAGLVKYCSHIAINQTKILIFLENALSCITIPQYQMKKITFLGWNQCKWFLFQQPWTYRELGQPSRSRVIPQKLFWTRLCAQTSFCLPDQGLYIMIFCGIKMTPSPHISSAAYN